MKDIDLPPDCHLVRNAVLIAGTDAADGQPADAVDAQRNPQLMLRGLGVRQADGTLAPQSVCHYRNRLRPISANTSVPLPNPEQRLEGLSIFGGLVGPQFGHMVTQSLGRLSICSRFPQARVVFLAEQLGFQVLPYYFVALLRAVGVTNPVQLVSASTRCEQLLIAPDLCNLQRRPCVSPAFLNWLDESRPAADLGPGDDLYVSRSALSLAHGQFLQETELEAALARSGYDIFHPEQAPIAEQVSRYRNARRILFADGSAAHLWSFFSRPDAKVAIILRRPPSSTFRAWFRSAGCPRPSYLDFGMADFGNRRDIGSRGVGLLDLSALWVALRDLEFHDDPDGIGIPRAQVLRWLAGLHGHQGRIPKPDFPLDPRSMALIGKRRRVSLRSAPETTEHCSATG